MRRSPKKSCVSCYYGSAKGSRFTSHADPKNVFFTARIGTRHQTPRKARELQRVCACKLSRFSYDCSDRNGTNPRGESSPIAGDAVPSPSVAFGPAASVPALAILCRLDDRSTPFPPAAAPRVAISASASRFRPAATSAAANASMAASVGFAAGATRTRAS